MAKASRDKGKRGEAEFEARYLTPSGLDFVREQDGRTQGADWRVGAHCIDSKRRERIEIVKWSREIEDRTPIGLVPVIAYRTNGEPWRVSLLAADYMDLLCLKGGT